MNTNILYKYILFDFDGTLIDTNELIVLALKETARKFLNKELTQDDLYRILGKHLEEQMRCLSSSSWKEMVIFYKDFYSTNKDSMVQEFVGTREVLKELKEIGCKTAIVSAKGRSGIEHGLELFGLMDTIDVIISAYDIQNNKPHPEPALKALELLEGEASKALMIGDSPYDILCGKNAGIKTVLVDWSIFPKHQLLKLEPDYVIKTPKDLLQIICS